MEGASQENSNDCRRENRSDQRRTRQYQERDWNLASVQESIRSQLPWLVYEREQPLVDHGILRSGLRR